MMTTEKTRKSPGGSCLSLGLRMCQVEVPLSLRAGHPLRDGGGLGAKVLQGFFKPVYYLLINPFTKCL